MAAHTILDDRDKRELQNSINLTKQKLQNDIDTYKQETDQAISDLREHTDNADKALKENLDSVELDLQTQINDNKAELQAEIDTNAADIATNRESIDLNRTTILNNKKELQKNIDTLEAETLEGFREVNDGLSMTKKELSETHAADKRKLEKDLTDHNVSPHAHDDMRSLIQDLTDRLNTLADSDDTTLDQLSEVVAYIKNNKSLIDGITTNKINFSDIADNLATNSASKVLSAAQGVVLKAMFDSIPEWSMKDEKPSYHVNEIDGFQSALDHDINLHNNSSTCHSDIREAMVHFQEDIDSLEQTKIDKDNIYNGLFCPDDGFVLDAKQGPVIKGMIDDINTEIEGVKTDLGNITGVGEGSIETTNIADGAITGEKIADGTIGSEKLDQSVQDRITTLASLTNILATDTGVEFRLISGSGEKMSFVVEQNRIGLWSIDNQSFYWQLHP